MTRSSSRAATWALAAVLLIHTPLAAQFVFFEGPHDRNQSRWVAVSADVSLTITADTPTGPYEQTLTARYWRSREGKRRIDRPFGTSVIEDFVNRRVVLLDHQQRVANVLQLARDEASKVEFPVSSRSRVFASLGADIKRHDLGDKWIEDYKTSGGGGSESGWTFEVWTAPDLQLPLYIGQHTAIWRSVQRYEHVQIEDPPESLFEIPSGYEVIEWTAPTNNRPSRNLRYDPFEFFRYSR